MSSIEKLLIRGIRSFSPDDTNLIEFYSPLTLIVGHNGSGKTTIIECLKYITTGDLPPNSKNGAFIHDPNILVRDEVLGQVKLRFRNLNDKEMVCTRSISLTQKQGSRTQKTLESLLSTRNDEDGGKSNTVSSKCADLDNELPALLGVSKAILENVIFCHQEDSLWPLAEPGTLKKKFDEIFASTKYSKVLESIRKIRKEQDVERKINVVELEHMKEKCEKAKQQHIELQVAETDMAAKRKRKDEVENVELESIREQMDEFDQIRKSLTDLQIRLKHTTHELETNNSSLNLLESTLEIYEESDDELQVILQNYMKSLEGTKNNVAKLEDENRALGVEINNNSKQHSSKLSERGQLTAEIEKAQFSVFYDPTLLEPRDITEFAAKLEETVQSKLLEQEYLKKSLKEKEHALMQSSQRLKSEVASFEEIKKLNKRQIEANTAKVAKFTAKLEQLQVSQSSLDFAHSTLKQEESNLKSIVDAHSKNNLDEKYTSLVTELNDIEKETGQVNESLALLNMIGEIRVKLEIKREEKAGKSRTLETLITGLKKDVNDVFGADKVFNIDTLQKDVESKYRAQEKSIKSIEAKLSQHKIESSSLNTKILMTRNEINDKSKRLDEKSAIMVRALGGSGNNYAAVLKDLDNQVENARQTVSTSQQAKAFYASFLRKANANHNCPLCRRGFEDDEAGFQSLIRFCESVLNNPNLATQQDETLQALLKKQESLQKLSSTVSDIKRIRDLEIANLSDKLETFEKEKVSLDSVVENLESELTSLKSDYNKCSFFLNSCSKYTVLSKEVNTLAEDIGSLEEDSRIRLGNTQGINFDDNMSMDELSKKLESLQDKGKSIRKEMDRINNEQKVRTRELQTREKKVQQAKEKYQNANLKYQESVTINKSLDEANAEINQIKQDVLDLDRKISEITPKISQTQQDLQKFQTEMVNSETESGNQVNELLNSLNHFKSLEQEIANFIRKGGQNLLTKCESEIARLSAENQKMVKKRNEITKNINEYQSRLDQVANVKRRIDDNVRYRGLQKTSERLKVTIEEINKELATIDKEGLKKRYTKLTTLHDKLAHEKGVLDGEILQLEQQISKIEGSFRKEYKGVEEKYSKMQLTIATNEMSNKDLGKYAKALEEAINRFHKLKMEEINKIIRELWVNTYQQSDIETIEIRSDADGASRASRSFNYRVVMVTEKAEMDMRGRCSAGQKVLASLIIRLALAETFGLNCGILALDEPTTNLDRANIESLADSLGNIIRTRRSQSNFQLIVITHDEEFLKILGKSEFTDYFWRIQKNAMGHSKIERHAISKRL